MLSVLFADAKAVCRHPPLTQRMFYSFMSSSSLSVYAIVARACYESTGKKTNPHLLRDMVVTHVRGTDASEKELEALALYMGHSINMQRSSYDRRTLTEKIAPAVDLLSKINRDD